jgi:hypothetical protein
MLDVEPRAERPGIVARHHLVDHRVVDRATIDRRSGGGEQRCC